MKLRPLSNDLPPSPSRLPPTPPPSPISDRVSGRLTPARRGYGDLPFPVRRNAPAFSLTEVVIALGIFAVSMVGVLALFPVASATSRESSEETQAAILAQTVFTDLRSSAAGRGATNAWLVSGKNTFGDFVSPIRLSVTADVAIAYDIKRRDWADSAAGGGTPLIGPPLALKALQAVSSNEYRAGVANLSNVTYLTQLRLEPVAGVPNLALATVEVSTPAAVGQTNRRAFQFSTLVFGP